MTFCELWSWTCISLPDIKQHNLPCSDQSSGSDIISACCAEGGMTQSCSVEQMVPQKHCSSHSLLCTLYTIFMQSWQSSACLV